MKHGSLIDVTPPIDNDASVKLATTAFAKSQDAVLAREPNQGVALTAAASGSSGIMVADNANINFGTGSFALVWKGSLPVWALMAAQYLVSKVMGPPSYAGFLISIQYSGQVRLELLEDNATAKVTQIDSTGIPLLINNTVHEVVVAIIPGVSCKMYVDGILFFTDATQILIARNINNTANFEVLGQSGTRYAGTCIHAYTLNFAPTAAEVLDMYRNGIPESWKWGSQTSLITGVNVDFATDAANKTAFNAAYAWQGNGATVVVSVTSKVVSITASAAGEGIYFPKVLTAGKRYSIRNLNVTGMTGTWTLQSYIGGWGNITSISLGVNNIEWSDVGSVDLGIDGSGGATITIDQSGGPLSLTEIGATLALTPESWQSDKPYDCSSNNLACAYPATGWSLTRKVQLTEDSLLVRKLSYYGVSWNESADTYVRTGTLAGITSGNKPLESLLTVQAKMRRCVVNDAGVVQYYLSATNSTKKEDGVTASVLDGTDGQVMVEIPKFWFRHGYVGTTHTWEISPISLAGFSVHPAFMSGAVELNYIYVGAYEGVLFDTSTGLYDSYATGDALDFTATTGDKLSSVSGKVPVSNGTRANFRAIAANRGAGWSQELYDIRSAVQLLYLTEYASFNSQSMIGLGICNVNDWATFSYYPFAPTGNSNSIGNVTGNTAGAVASYASEASKYMSYRGIEQWYGHLWKWLDGINTNNNRSYICNVAANLADDTASNYTDIGINNINGDGYQATLLNISRGFLPGSVGADAATKITDYCYQNTGWRVAASGGDADNALVAGGFYLSLSNVSADLDADVGARLCFRKVSIY